MARGKEKDIILLSVTQNEIRWEFIPVKHCPICSSERLSKYHEETRRGLPLVFTRCQSCQALIQNPRLSPESLKAYFSSSYFIGRPGAQPQEDDLGYFDYSAWEKSYRENAGPLLHHIRRKIPPPARLLEIGGATGWLLKAARDEGYEVTGLDISAELARSVEAKYGIQVRVSSIEEAQFLAGSFDVLSCFGGIACWQEPRTAFEKIRSFLRPRGIFCFNYTDHQSITAYLRGRHFYEYNHASLVIYTRNAIHRLLKQYGFRMVSEKTHIQKASLGRIASYLKFNRLYQLLTRLGLNDLSLWVPAVGTRLVLTEKL